MARMATLAGGRHTRRLPGPDARLLTSYLPLGVMGLGLWALFVGRSGAIGFRTSIPAWVFLAACVVASSLTLEVSLHRTPIHLSLNQVPIVVGLFLMPPSVMIGCYLLGATGGAWIRRGLSPYRDLANLCGDSFLVAVAVIVLRSIGVQTGDPLSLHNLGALSAAMLATGLLSAGVFEVTLSIYRWQIELRSALHGAALLLLSTVLNASLGVLALIVVVARPWLFFALIPPLGLALLARSLYGEKRLEARRMALMYEMSELLHGHTSLVNRSNELLDRLAVMFDAGRAELMVVTDRGRALRITSNTGGSEADRVAAIELSSRERRLLARLRADRRTVVQSNHKAPTELSELVRDRQAPNGMAALLRGGNAEAFGLLLLLAPRAGGGRFSGEMATLLGSIAGQIGKALEHGRLAEEVRALELEKLELNQRVFHDPLTRLANRSLFNDRVAHALVRSERGERPMAVLFIDLDDFKSINDAHGQAAGDQLLTMVAERLRQGLRGADIAARFAGDEFGLLLEQMSSTDDAITVAERLVASLSQPYQVHGKPITARASVGVALVSEGAQPQDVAQVMQWADTAMFAAKRRGKGSYAVFQPGMDEALSERLTFEVEMRRALASDELFLQYQPIVEVATGRMRSVEALVRWRHPSRGVLPPNDFIPMAEETGFIVALGRWVLRSACLQAVRLRARPPRLGLHVAVTTSAQDLLSDTVNEDLAAILIETGLEPAGLVIEVTESALLSDMAQATERLIQVRAMGVRVALDDFGTGFSSLSYLHDLPVDIIKIDRCFLATRRTDDRHREFLRAIYTLGRSLGLVTVAEGVEEAADLALLKRLGVDQAQGFYFSRPVDSEVIEPMLLERLALTSGPARRAPVRRAG
ncbi:MAG: hypothetical protein NVSMB29_05390 [Candidatus Dormibacteria bacterium]